MSEHILVVDDETSIRAMLRMALQGEGFKVSEASNAHQAEVVLEQSNVDVILLDWMMPGISGVDFTARLRKQDRYRRTGIILVTAKNEEDDLLRGLSVGADDYVSKPFSSHELTARIRAVLRRLRVQEPSDEILSSGKITLNPDQHRVSIDAQTVDFSPTEFRLLHFFMSHPNRAYHRDQLLDQVWGEQTYVEDRTVDVHIRRLRKILDPFECDGYIRTVRGVGYQFIGPE